MITIFASPKSFKGQIAVIQRNAIISWMLLRPPPEIILFGNEEGTADICQELGLRHIPEVARNKFGTPLVNDLFEKTQQLATYDLVCYINADIIVTQNLIDATNIVRQRWKRFVISCTTWSLSMENKIINFTSSNWQEQLRDMAQKNGIAPQSIGMDLFLFPRGLYHHIPPFAIGRMVWDNWLIFKARSQKIPLVDISQFVLTVHPDHKESTHSGPHIATEESRINQRLVGWWSKSFIGLDATYNLERNGQLRKKRILELLKPRIEAMESCYLIDRPIQGLSYFKRKLVFLLRKTKFLK